jgi:hypothetical protein
MQRSRLVNALCLLWLISWTALSYAATTFAEDVYGYDWQSLLLAGAAGVLGGVARTILALASNQVEVYDVLRDLVKNLVVALISGGIAYIIVQAWNSLPLLQVPREVRMLLIASAGWAPMRFNKALDRLAGDLLANLRRRARGGVPDDLPSSASAPLETKP